MKKICFLINLLLLISSVSISQEINKIITDRSINLDTAFINNMGTYLNKKEKNDWELLVKYLDVSSI